MRKIKTNKKAFTLIELVVVLAILAIVFSVITMLMQFSTRTLASSNLQYDKQLFARQIIVDIKNELSFTSRINLYTTTQTAATSTGYIYYDSTNRQVVIKGQKAATAKRIDIPADLTNVSLLFNYVLPSNNNTKISMIDIQLIIDQYVVETEVYIQNLIPNGGIINAYGEYTEPNLFPYTYIEILK